MKRIDSIIRDARDKINKPKPYQKEVTDQEWDMSFSIINRLFEELTAIFNASHQTWRTDHELAAAKNQWLIGLVENRIFQWERIEIALTKCRAYPKAFCPNIGEFIGWCNYSPEDLGLPNIHDAYTEAIKNYGQEKENPKWSHVVVRHAAYYSKSYELMNLHRDKSFALFERNYQQAVKMYINCDIGDVNLALPGQQDEDTAKKEGIVMEKYRNVRGASAALAAMKSLL